MSNEEQSIKDRIKEIESIIGPLSKERAELNQRLLELASQFKVGDIITWGRTGRLLRGRVTGISKWTGYHPCWTVTNILKDGTDGATREVRPYDNPTLVKP